MHANPCPRGKAPAACDEILAGAAVAV